MSPRAVSQAAIAALFAAVALARATTYHPWADGSALEYGRAAVLALGIALMSWVAVRATIPRRPALWVALPWLTAAAALLPSTAVHYLRINHPIALSGLMEIEDDFDRGTAPDPRTWIVEVRGEASASIREGTVVLSAPAGSAAFVELVTPDRPDPNRNEFWLPRGLYLERYDESLEWEASIALESDFSVVLETRQLLVQATPYGLHLSFPDVHRRVTEHHMEIPDLKNGAVRHFRLERTDGLIRLRVGDASGWVQPDTGRFGIVRFGETRPDPLHAGTLSLQRARYVRRYHGA